MGRTLRVGDYIVDNDPRRAFWRVLRVTRITTVGSDGTVIANDEDNRQTSISLRRVHTDDKPRRSGFSLLEGFEPYDYG